MDIFTSITGAMFLGGSDAFQVPFKGTYRELSMGSEVFLLPIRLNPVPEAPGSPESPVPARAAWTIK